jgi:drug/metabolite transporter (DMT)-like permease
MSAYSSRIIRPRFIPSFPVISLLIGAVFWGLLWWPLKLFAQNGLTSIFIGIVAYLMVAIIAIPVLWVQRKYWCGEWKLLLLIGLFFSMANMSFNAALMNGEVVRVMLLFYLLPAWGALGGVLVLGERLSKQRCIATVASLSGVFVIMGVGNVSWDFSLADLMALVAGFCLSAAGVVNKLAIKIPMASRSFIPFIFCPILAALAHYFFPAPTPEISLTLWLLLAAFAFIWILGATIFTTIGVTHIEASRASILQVTELFVAIITAIVLGGEKLELKEYIGGILIVAATLLEVFDTDSISAK